MVGEGEKKWELAAVMDSIGQGCMQYSTVLYVLHFCFDKYLPSNECPYLVDSLTSSAFETLQGATTTQLDYPQSLSLCCCSAASKLDVKSHGVGTRGGVRSWWARRGGQVNNATPLSFFSMCMSLYRKYPLDTLRAPAPGVNTTLIC